MTRAGRVLLILGALAFALSWPLSRPVAAAAPCPGDGPCVVITVVGTASTSHTFTLDDIAALQDLSRTYYTLREADGDTTSVGVDAATSLRALIGAIPAPGGGFIDPDAVTYTEVIDTDGDGHPLGEGDLGPAGSNGFVGGLMPAVYDDGGAGTNIAYLRPLRSATDVNLSGDPNLGGFLTTRTDDALEITVHTSGRLLSPTITPSATTTDITVPVSFSVSFGSAPGTALTYDWDFGDGSHSAEAAPSHTWTTTGKYSVTLTVTGADGSWGRSSSVAIQVGDPPSASPTPTPGSGEPSISSGPSLGPTTGNGHHQGGKVSATASPSAGLTTGAGPGGTSGPSPTAAPTSAATSSAPSHPSSSGEEVSGILLDAMTLEQAPSQDAPAPQDAAAAARGGAAERSWGVPVWAGRAGGGLLIVLIAGLGALAEARPGGLLTSAGRLSRRIAP